MNPLTAPVSIYVPRDSAARSVGADEVADALTKAAERQGRSRSGPLFPTKEPPL